MALPNPTFVKAAVNASNDQFGRSVSVSGNGLIMVVGAPGVSSGNSTGFADVYRRNTIQSPWTHEIRLLGNNSGPGDHLGYLARVSSDGSTIAVSAWGEDTSAAGINPASDDLGDDSGAVYIFTRGPAGWRQDAMLKASNPDNNDYFGDSLELSADGNVLVVGADGEDSAATGVNGNQADNTAVDSGAAYVFRRTNQAWGQTAYLKASNTGADDGFANWLALSADGTTIAVIAWGEDSNGRGVGAVQTNDLALDSGALYVFQLGAGAVWQQTAYIKSANSDVHDEFPIGVALSADGTTLAAGTGLEDSSSASNPGNNGKIDSGAVYIFSRATMGNSWSQTAYLKAANLDADDEFGSDVALSGDGNTLVVAARLEDGSGAGFNPPTDNAGNNTGAAYVFQRTSSTWTQMYYLKASLPEANDQFGNLVSISQDGHTIVIGVPHEDSIGTGPYSPSEAVNTSLESGAAYVFQL